MNVWVRRTAVSLAGAAVVVAGIFYYAWATALSADVDWASVASLAAFFAPFGIFAALFDEIGRS